VLSPLAGDGGEQRPAPAAEQVQVRSLADYDAALGLTDGGVA
jgi:hypothetical protein